MKPFLTPKMCIKKGGKLKRINFWSNESSEGRLNYLRSFYAQHLGRKISNTIIVRRALEVLTEHTKSIDHKGIANLANAEVLKLVKHIR